MGYVLILAAIMIIILAILLIVFWPRNSNTNIMKLSSDFDNINFNPKSLIKNNIIANKKKNGGVTFTELNHKNINIDNNGLTYFNMSTVKDDMSDNFIGVVRASENVKIGDKTIPFSYVFTVVIGRNNNVEDLTILNLDYDKFVNCNTIANGIEDSRLFKWNSDYWCIANSLGLLSQTDVCKNNMCIYMINNPISTFRILKVPPSYNPMLPQKNWSPFAYNGKLYCEYSINPHVILEIDSETGDTFEVYNTLFERTSTQKDESVICSMKINLDKLRGGTPSVLVEHNSEPVYLGIGHSQLSVGNYGHFFYTFQASPPFSLKKISDYFKFDGGEVIQFACGLSVSDDKVYVSYGVNDTTNRISTYRLDRVLSLLY